MDNRERAVNDREKYSLNDIFRMLEKQSFVNWNECEFESYVTGDSNAKTRRELEEDLERLLK